MAITKVELKNFTVFNDIEIDFSSKINVIIGDNGAGKTHLLKALYAVCEISKSKNISDVSKYFRGGDTDTFFVRQLKPLLLKVAMGDQLLESNKVGFMTKLSLVMNNIKVYESNPNTPEASYEIYYPAIQWIQFLFLRKIC